jgi:hypothetical protein
MQRLLLNLLILVALAGCSSPRSLQNRMPALSFVGAYTLSLNMQFHGTTVGGLSGIDYDPVKNIYYIISDDGSKVNPARFYTAAIGISEKGISKVELRTVVTLRDSAHKLYSRNAVDPEAIRYYPPGNTLFWSSEGRRNPSADEAMRIQPAIYEVRMDGSILDSLRLPANMHFAEGRGPRHNEVFEGLAFDAEHRHLFVSTETPLLEDGLPPGTGDSSALVRIIRFDMATRAPLAQYAYRVDPVAQLPVPAGAFRINGISEIMYWSHNQLLVVERSFSSGHKGCVIKLYLADLDSGDVLKPGTPIEDLAPLKKRLLFDMRSLRIPVYNIEGVTEGPRLKDGSRTLVFVADDNFSSNDLTQFLLFSVN